MSLYEKWMKRTLTVEDIKVWLKEQGYIRFLLEKEVLDEERLNHVATCMHHVYLWYWDD